MNVAVLPSTQQANEAAADLLCRWLLDPPTRTLMVAAGNTPLALYALVAQRRPALPRLEVFALDEYVGVPVEEPRNCANLLRASVARAWNIPDARFHGIRSDPAEALRSALETERRIEALGGLDVLVLGLGQNGHLGFNEPGSTPDSTARLLRLAPISVEANRQWFGGAHAPDQGVTVGLRTLLAARRILLLAYGAHKADAVRAMIEGPAVPSCPASFLQGHPETHVILDPLAATRLGPAARSLR